MNITQIKSAIAERLTETGREHWNGTTEQNEFVILAQRSGIDAAVKLIEELASHDLVEYDTNEVIRQSNRRRSHSVNRSGRTRRRRGCNFCGNRR